MMEDKKRKKFGLSLKNAKKLAVPKSEVKEQASSEVLSTRNAKELKAGSLLGEGRSSCLEEIGHGLKRKLKLAVNTSAKESLGRADNEEERERILWKNLFSVSCSANWEAMEDLPIPTVSTHTSDKKHETSSSTGIEKKGNGNTTSSLALVFEANPKTDTFDIDLDYKDLPKPCINCYARKPSLLTWSQDDGDKKMKEKDTFNISPSSTDSTLDLNASSMKRNSAQNNLNPASLFQSKSHFFKSQTNVRPTADLFHSNMKRKESILKNKVDKNQTISLNAGCRSQSSEEKNHKDVNSASNRTINKVIDLTNDSQEKSDNRGRNGKSLKQNNYGFHKSPSGLINANLQANSEKPSSGVGDSGAKMNVAVVGKEILKCCPICQFQFPQRMDKQGMDQHISSCIGNEDLFVDDDEDDW